MAFWRASYCCLVLLLLLYLAAALEAASANANAGPQPPVRGRASNPSPRLPRTSASQLSAQNNATTTRGMTSKNVTSSNSSTSAAAGSQAAQGRGNYRTSIVNGPALNSGALSYRWPEGLPGLRDWFGRQVLNKPTERVSAVSMLVRKTRVRKSLSSGGCVA
uniref:Uncharacterized protein n=1 Tax=Anopheles atroparvus TaxID=41427 RepID=A0A182IVC6_ANOAO